MSNFKTKDKNQEMYSDCVFFSTYRSSSTNQADLNMKNKLDYLSQLLKDKGQLATSPNIFIHVERLLDQGECGICQLFHIKTKNYIYKFRNQSSSSPSI